MGTATATETVARAAAGGVSVTNRIDTRRRRNTDAVPALTTLLGPQRAEILRLLQVPATCGEIAEALIMVPGGVTHHLRSLEAAGLARRTRQGRHVLVERTARGNAVMALFAEDHAAPHRSAARCSVSRG